jgi:hypothetical protein
MEVNNMTVLEYMKSTFDKANPYHARDRVECNDGFSISVQGGDPHHYCEPRQHINEYYSVELGFPSSLDGLISEYAETPDTTETVFGYVPISLAEQLIVNHGGIK